MNPKYAHLTLPPFCSPAIYQLNASEKEDDISEWEALHLAGLDENPAYGAKVAILKGTCIGTEHACSIQFRAAKQVEIACPFKIEQVREKLAGTSTYGRPTKPVKITAFGEPKPFTDEDQKELDKVSKPFNQRVVTDKESLSLVREKISRLKKNQRIASVEEALRGRGRSVDGSHSQSTFLTSKGDFVGGDGIHVNQLGILDEQMESKLKEHNLIRVQNFPINRAGEKKTSVGIVSRPSAEQLRAIRDLESNGQVVGFAVGPTGHELTGNGYRDMLGALRQSGLL